MAFQAGDRMLHLDLHPANVMLTSRGPVVIDWSGARAGAAGADVAMAYVIMASSDVDLIPVLLRPVVSRLRAALLRQFMAEARDDPGPHIARAAEARMEDPNIRRSEVGRLQRIAGQGAAGWPGRGGQGGQGGQGRAGRAGAGTATSPADEQPLS
jgi:hypothetical protein